MSDLKLVKKYTEADLAEQAKLWLESNGWRVYEEVSPGPGYKIADLLGVKRVGSLWVTHVVEVKKSFSLGLVDQCLWWQRWAYYVTAAYAAPSREAARAWSWDTSPIRAIARGRDIGRLEVGSHTRGWARCPAEEGLRLGGGKCSMVEEPRINRRARHLSDLLIKRLRPEQHHPESMWASAGAKDARRVSAFQLTCVAVAGYVETHPGCSAREIVENISHHYSSNDSAASALVKWGGLGKIRGVRLERPEGRGSFQFYPAVREGDR